MGYVESDSSFLRFVFPQFRDHVCITMTTTDGLLRRGNDVRGVPFSGHLDMLLGSHLFRILKPIKEKLQRGPSILQPIHTETQKIHSLPIRERIALSLTFNSLKFTCVRRFSSRERHSSIHLVHILNHKDIWIPESPTRIWWCPKNDPRRNYATLQIPTPLILQDFC